MRIWVETEFTLQAPGENLFQSVWKGRQKQRADTWEPILLLSENVGKQKISGM